MAIFCGKYHWDGTRRLGKDPISWFAGTYELKIFNCSGRAGNVEQLKPYLCLYAHTGDGQSISANPERFAKQVCNDFGLEIERVLWVEDLQKVENRYEVLHYTRSGRLGPDVLYRIDRRTPKKSELALIAEKLELLKSSGRDDGLHVVGAT